MGDQKATVDQLNSFARQLFKAKKLPEALHFVNVGLQQNPNHADCLSLKGLIDICDNRLESAAKRFRRVLTIVPEHDEAQEHLVKVEGHMTQMRATPYATAYAHNQSVYMDYPRNIGIETVGRCNAKCSFCPHGDLDRKFSIMEDKIFDKIISDLEKIPSNIPINIFPNWVNEPFMDRKIFTRLKRINACLPQATLSIFTNFNVVNKKFFQEFSQIKNIRLMNVSFNSGNKEEYEKVMKIDFERTVQNLKTLMTKNREENFFDSPVCLSRVASLSEGDDRYHDECEQVFSEFVPGVDFITRVKNRTNWLGESELEQSQIPNDLPCNSWFDINISCTGMVPHCCMDAKGTYSIGDVNESSVLEIYNHPKFRFMREKLTTRESVSPCNTCSLLQ